MAGYQVSLFGYRYLGDGRTDQRENLHNGTCVVSPFGAVSRSSPKLGNNGYIFCNFGRLTANMLKSQLQLNMSSTRGSKNISHGAAAPRGVHYKQKHVAFLSISAAASVINARSTDAWQSTHEWHERIFVDGGRDGRSVYVRQRRTRRTAVIDRYFLIHHLHWTPPLIVIVYTTVGYSERWR